jgi:glycerol-3-phosphate dehydrogenase
VFDLAVIGGGVNGAGIARDAAGRGLKVLLVEQGDLAGATSSASTKLIHGGLRYLEHYEFRLVHEALTEREVLLRAAPHIVWPLRFVLPHHAGLRPWWLIRLGLFLYDHLGGRKILPPTRSVDLRNDPVGAPLRPDYTRAFEYSDCWVDDARLVVLLARDAANHGADIRTRTRCLGARVVDGAWRLALGDGTECTARALVNAAGPWVSHVLGDVLGHTAPARVRLVKGSHIVVRRLFAHDRCYIFQNRDGRICFAIPYEQDFTLIGTTDADYAGDPSQVAISPAEETYLRDAVSAYLRRPIEPADIVWRYAGVRPLRDDGAGSAQETTRDYVLEMQGTPPLLSVFGGKITTHRRLAEAAMTQLARYFPDLPGNWTASASLPGGDFPWDGVAALRQATQLRYPFLPDFMVHRLIRSYGTLTPDMLGDAACIADLGRCFGADLTEREVVWLRDTEWARTAEDVLWRRSKLGLRFSPAETAALGAWLEA